MRVEIAICTWNRAKLLRDTLASLTALEIPNGVDWRVIVVDNHSTDETADVIRSFNDRLPLRPEFEPLAGHTHARNRAVAVSTGDLIVWTDDDVRVDRRWLCHYHRAAREQPEIDFWGGRIQPCFIEAMPAWIAARWQVLSGAFAERNLGDQPVDFTPHLLPYGANFAVRGEVQRAFRFDTSLGRVGQQVLGEDELDLMRRLLQAGHRGRWVPDSLVEHLIGPDRASPDYIYRYFYGQGMALVRQGRPWTASRWGLHRWAAYYALLYWIARYVTRSTAWVDHLIARALARGQLDA